MNVFQGKQKLSLSVDRFPILEKEQRRKRKAEYAAYQRRPSWFPFDLRICLRIEYRFFFFSTIIISMERRSWFNGIKNGVKIGWRGFYSQGRSVSLPISGKTDRTFALNPTLMSPCSSRHFHVFFLPNIFDNMSPRFVSASSVWVWRRIDVARIFGIDLFISKEKEIIVITADHRYDIWSFARRLIIIITWESHRSIETILQLFFPLLFFTKKKI